MAESEADAGGTQDPGATYQDLFGSDEEEEQEQPGVAEGGAAGEGPAEGGAAEDGEVEGGGEGEGGGDGEDGEGGEGDGNADDLDLFGEREEEEEAVVDDERGVRSARQAIHAEDMPRAPPMHLEIPELPRPKPGQLCLVRLPNILGIEARPFDPTTFEPDQEAERGAARENVIRWRYAASGEAAPGGGSEPQRESNARVVRWSDGSLTLHIGSEVLLAAEQPFESEHAHVFAKHASVIECHGVLSHRLHFQPATRDSATHRKLMSKVQSGAKQAKERKIRMTATLSDPEKAKEAMERLEEEKKRLLLSQDRAAAAFGSARWDSGFLEGDEEEAGAGQEGNLGAIRAAITGRKRRAPAGGARARRPSRPRRMSGVGAGRRLSGGGSAARRRRMGDEDEDEEEEEEGSDEMEGFIVDDEEDEAGDDGDEDEL